MYTGINVQSLVPDQFVIDDPKSASKAIIKKDILRIPSRDPAPYGYATNTSTSFFISSPQDFLDCKNTYFELAGQTRAGIFPDQGVHACFERVEIRGIGSTMIQEQDQYHVWSGLVWDLFEEAAPNKINDFLADGRFPDNMRFMGTIAVTQVATGFTIASNTNPFVSFNGGIAQGDWFMCQSDVATGNGYRWYRLNTTAPADNIYGVAVGNLTPVPVALFAGNVNVYWFRHSQVTTSGLVSAQYFRPKMSFFELVFPLFLMKQGIEIRFFWARPSIVLTAANAATAPAILTYSVFNCWATFITPHSDVISEYVAQWQSPAGILYYLPSTRVRIYDNTNGTAIAEWSQNFNVRSARQMYIVPLPQEAFGADAVANLYSLSGSITSSTITDYLVRVGAYLYPLEKVAEATNDTNALRALKQLIMQTSVIGRDGKKLAPEFYWKNANILWSPNAVAKDAKGRLYIAIDFSRHDGVGAELTGVDLATVNVDTTLTRNSTDSFIIRFFSYMIYDAYLKLAQAQMMRIE
jgi:hypothetical protein